MAAPPAEPLRHIARHRGARLDFDRVHIGALLHEEIDFVAGTVSPKIEGRRPPVIVICLGCFRDDEILEERAPQRMGFQLIPRADAEQMTSQSRIEKIQLGAFNEPLAEISMVRREGEENEARFVFARPARPAKKGEGEARRRGRPGTAKLPSSIENGGSRSRRNARARHPGRRQFAGSKKVPERVELRRR